MKNNKFIILILSLVLLTTWSCRDFEELKQNSNVPNNVSPSMLLKTVLYKLHRAPSTMDERRGQYYLCNYDYYGNNRYDFGAGEELYTTITNVVKMEEEAKRLGLPDRNVYSALGKFLKAYFFSTMSLQMGDIPMSEALKGAANMKPKYDTQKEVFNQCFTLLEEANTDITALIGSTTGGELSGDFYFANDLKQWQKTVNTFRLRLLIHLSKKESDATLNIKKQFSDIVSNPTKYPIMTSSSDDLKFVYLYPSNLYPKNPGNFGFDALRYNSSATYVKLLTNHKDPRVFVTCEPADSLNNITSDTTFASFAGANPGEDLGVMGSNAGKGLYSLINRYRYYRTYTGEPSLELSFTETCFTIAEAINRGWLATGPVGDAEAYYTAGIKASMATYGIPEKGNFTAYFFKNNAKISEEVNVAYKSYSIPFDFSKYYAQDSVKYAGNNAAGLTQILKQKYIALYQHAGLESYFTYRRTGVPSFSVGAGTGNSGRIPLRFQYFSTEDDVNLENYTTAIERYAKKDDINGKMWLLE